MWRGEPAAPWVALTFDDGPKPELSLPILNILDAYHIKATFFVVGREAQKHPDIILRMYESGHDVGNHSFTHRSFEALSVQEVRRELAETNRVVSEITGVSPVLLRAPGGAYGGGVLREARRQGLVLINWTINTADYVVDFDAFEVEEDPEKVADYLVQTVAKALTPGAIILFHNGGKPTELALPRVIELCRDQGYRFVTVGTLIGTPTYFNRLATWE